MTASIPYANISPLAENVSSNNPALKEIANDFLSSISPEDREKTQTEVYKFIRWLGPNRKTTRLTPMDIDSYGELVSSAGAKSVKSFLSYLYKKGYTGVKLAPHLRAKKASSKVVACQQNAQAQAILTEQGLAKLEEELADLKAQIPDIIKEMQRAAADKDFRENAPLHAARDRKAQLEGRIKELESTLEIAKVMEERQVTSRIKLGDSVVLCDLASGNELRYALVHPQEANATNGRLSIVSPLGKVLLDKEKGQTIEVAAPAGTFCYRVEDILSSNLLY